MPDTIESFVAKLQAEGVDAGQQEARKLLEQAQQRADEIIQQAKEQAAGIVADARKQAETLLARAHTELRLAARDTVLRLREVLNRALEAVLGHAVAKELSDDRFVGQVLHELVLKYAQADIDGVSTMEIDVSRELRDRLAHWAIGEIHGGAEGKSMSIDLRGDLETAGFEYNVSGATVEVTVSSVVELLAGLVGPKLREVLDQAIGDLNPQAAGESGDKPTQ